ncbi:hypothetical protein DFH07DRAFT_852673 [Mycena maculata]|uniref:Uncharacterized protein n=1 Tax=Mycena maculata TaxID=230809 RepID=A0AAD7MPU8_9AGAR|nr:hypothetical protein DFH07DRAFT_852673 [Mycena maculata]
MARTVVARTRAFLFFLVLILLFLSPHVLAAFPQTASAAPAFSWVTGKIQEGLIVACLGFTLYFIHSLFVDFRTWLTRTTPATEVTPTTLESGIAAAPLIDLDAEVGATEAAPTTPSPVASASTPAKPTTASKIAVILIDAYAVLQYFYLNSIVSLNKPFLENISATLLFLLRGLEVLFVGFLLLAFVAWLVKPKPAVAPAPAAPIEVLVVVEETMMSDVDVPKEKEEEKQYLEAIQEKAAA